MTACISALFSFRHEQPSQYRYTPLPQGSTRLVIIDGGPPTAPICCKFRVQRVKSSPASNPSRRLGSVQKAFKRRTVKYEALSYAWGDEPQPKEVILCDGQPLNITANLADAIRHLRHPHQPRTLWIDQICINQGDSTERSTQDPEDHAPIAERFLHDIADGRFKDAGEYFYRGKERFLSDHGLPEEDAPEWISINALLGRRYFTRLWVLQEGILARRLTFLDQARVSRFYAYSRLRSEQRRTIEQCIYEIVSRDCKVEADRIYSILDLVDDGPPIVPDYTIPTAKVFCDVTLDICALRKNLDILGDVYHREEDELRPAEWPTWVPRWNLGVPCQVAYFGPCSVSGTMDFVPPRLVDAEFRLELDGLIWDVESVARNESVIASQSKGLLNPIPVADTIQHIWGAWTTLTGNAAAMQRNAHLVQDFIWTLLLGMPDGDWSWLEEAWSDSQIYQDFAAYWANLLLVRVLEGVPDPIEFVSSRTKLAGMAALRYRHGREPSLGDFHDAEDWESRIVQAQGNPREFAQNFAEEKREILSMISPLHDKATAESVTDAIACFYPNSDATIFQRGWDMTGVLRSFFILKDGYIGMGPHIMRDTDVVAIFAGSSLPYVLRPTAGGYMFLGECYVHKIMQGEFVHELESKGLLESATRKIVLC